MRCHPARWTARLGCGHDARVQGQPEPGLWITCLECQCQRPVVSVTAIPGAPEPGQAGIQDPLWGDAALPVAAMEAA